MSLKHSHRRNQQAHHAVIYESVEQRDQILKLPFSMGINMAHNRIEEIVRQLKYHTVATSIMNPRVDFFLSRRNAR